MAMRNLFERELINEASMKLQHSTGDSRMGMEKKERKGKQFNWQQVRRRRKD